MCIACNVMNAKDFMVPHEFLGHFQNSQRDMAAACQKMLECSKAASDPEHRRQYDHAHKRMVRIMREWNKIEHIRELPLPPNPHVPIGVS